MKLVALLCGLVAIFGCIQSCQGDATKTVICSRIISVKEQSGPDKIKLAFGGKDPIGCQNYYGDKLLRDGLHASKCEESWFDLKDGASSFVRSISLLDRSGSLTAFRTAVNNDNKVRTPLCFRHNVPMGGGKFADDSPRCFNPNGGSFLMYLARKCTNDWCATYWLTAVEGKCDGTQLEPEPKKDDSSGGDQKKEAQEKGGESNSKDAEKSESKTEVNNASPNHSASRKMIDLSKIPLPPQSGK